MNEVFCLYSVITEDHDVLSFFLRNQALSSCQVSFVRRLFFIYIRVLYTVYVYIQCVYIYTHIYVCTIYVYIQYVYTRVCVYCTLYICMTCNLLYLNIEELSRCNVSVGAQHCN